jgi:aspartate carbamoyltransferase catalytic subunit
MSFVSFDSPRRLIGRTSSPQIRRARPSELKHLLSVKTLDSDAVDDLCQLADAYEMGSAVPRESAGKTVALLFFQASTRTRLGFEAATIALGSHPVGLDDMAASRSNERSAESLEDCGAVVSRLCDAIVVRHHESGAAARMAATSQTPVINAGDGWNEHPTQALSDIFALRRGLGSIRGTSIGIIGDPRGRTVRSLVHLLRYEAPREIVFCPPAHYQVPDELLHAIAEFQIRYRVIDDIKHALTDCDAIMLGPYDMSDIGEPAASGYISPRATPENYRLTAEKIEATRSKSLLYHPLPRRDEVDYSCDDLPNALYFEQVRLSKFMRMAVLTRMFSAN